MSNETANTKRTEKNQKLAKRGRNEVDDDDLPGNELGFEIKEMLTALSVKMDTLQESMPSIDTSLNSKIDNLEVAMSTRISDVKNEL